MKKENEDPKVCANPGCGRPAGEDGSLCDSCILEWTLFHREVRSESEDSLRLPQPPSASALGLS